MDLTADMCRDALQNARNLAAKLLGEESKEPPPPPPMQEPELSSHSLAAVSSLRAHAPLIKRVQFNTLTPLLMVCLQRTPWGGVEKRGGRKTSRLTPLSKRGFWTPLVRYVFHPSRVSLLYFSCTKLHD